MPADPDGSPAGKRLPRIDRNRCEGKAECVRVCPYDVFELRPLAAPDRAALSLRGRLKALVHGGRQAYLARPDDCRNCGLCVQSCPEQAIVLRAAE